MRISRRYLILAALLLAGGMVVWRVQLRRPSAESAASSPSSTARSSDPTADRDPARENVAADATPPDSGPSAVPLPTPVAPPWIHTFDRLSYGMRWADVQPPELAAFREWTGRYLVATAPAERTALEAEGLALARLRRPVMRRLIEQDPERALTLTIPYLVRALLPPAVTAELEQRVAGVGDYAVVPDEPQALVDETAEEEHDSGKVRHLVGLDGVSYVAHVYGRRRAQLTEQGVSLHGLALDQQLALHESPVRILDPGETPLRPAEMVDPATGQQQSDAIPAVEANRDAPHLIEFDGRVWALADPNALSVVEGRLRALERLPGPFVPPFEPGVEVVPPTAEAAPTAWTTGTKKVLLIRVDFPDVTGQPVHASNGTAITTTYAQSVLNNEVRPFYVENSYNQTTLTATVSNSVYRMPKAASTYASADDLMGLFTDATTKAASNYTIASYDFVQIVFSYIGPQRIPGSQFGFAGVAFRGGSQSFINGWYQFDVVAHELGHNYGLAHANLWRSYYGDPVGDTGTTQEYGDTFDIMGGGSTPGIDRRHHINPWFKNELGWLPDSAVTFASSSGTYRVHRFDSQDAPRTHPLALNVFRDGCRSYWIGHRRSFTGAIASSAYVQWGFYSNQQSQLLDLNTPGNDLSDAGLAPGGSLNDSVNGVILRHAGQGGAAPSEYLDIEVTVSPPTRNIVAQWGEDDAVRVPPGLRDVVALAAGDEHGLALKRNGSLVAWGDNNPEGSNRFGELNIPGSAYSSIASIAAGGDSSGVVRSDGTVVVWGLADFGQNNIPAGLNNVKQLVLGGDQALALKNDGTVVAWGSNAKGQISVPAGLTGVKALSAGRDMTLALLDNGTVLHWGVNADKLPANLTNMIAVAAGWGHGLALRSDGTVVAWGDNSDGQATVPADLNNVKQIGAGHLHSVALKNDGTIVAWGNNDFRQVTVPRGLPAVDTIAVAENHCMGLILGTNRILISQQPQDITVNQTNGASFSVEAADPSSVTYRWQQKLAGSSDWTNLNDGGNVFGATRSMIFISAVNFAMSGNQFRCIVANGLGADVISGVATLTVRPSPLVVRTHPWGQVTGEGEVARFGIFATGQGANTYQWQQRSTPAQAWTDVADGGIFFGAATSSFAINPVSIALNGAEYRCVVRDAVGQSVASNPASLVVLAALPGLGLQPGTDVPTSGSMITLSAPATGAASWMYQWRRDGTAIPGAMGASLVLPDLEGADSGFYDVILTTSEGVLTSKARRVEVQAASYPDAFRPSRNFRAIFENPGGTVHQVLCGPRNELYVMGEFTTVSGARRVNLARLHPDGSIDAAFRPAALRGGPVSCAAIQQDGKVVIGGSFTHVDDVARASLARLNADGSVDATFPGSLSLSGGVGALLIQADGQIVVGGSFSVGGGTARAYLMRLTSSGEVDPTFNNGPALDNAVWSLGMQSDGKVLAAGSFQNAGRPRFLARWNADGSWDATFTPNLDYTRVPEQICLQPDGKILLRGDRTESLIRLLPSGALDTNFRPSFRNRSVESVAMQGGGIVVVTSYYGIHYEVEIVRLNSDGSLDPTFRPIANFDNSVKSLAVTSHGSLVVGGSFDKADSAPTPRLAAFTADGFPDRKFVGRVREAGIVRAVVPQSGAKWLVAGDFNYVNGSEHRYLVRLNSDGSVDPDFEPLVDLHAPVAAVAALPDGKVIASGSFGPNQSKLARFNKDGSVASLFPPEASANQVGVFCVQPDGRVWVGSDWTGSTGIPNLQLLTHDNRPDLNIPVIRMIGGVFVLAWQANDRLLVGGQLNEFNGRTGLHNLVRIDRFGGDDLSFVADTAFNLRNVAALAMQPDQKILAASDYRVVFGNERFLLRLNPDGSLDPSFSPGRGADDSISALALQADGRIVAGGKFRNYGNSPSPYLARINGDGTPDHDFAVEGLNFDPNAAVRTLSATADGLLLAGGDWLTFDNFDGGGGLVLLEAARAPEILTQPEDQLSINGDMVAFEVTVPDGDPVTFEWRKDGRKIPGATSARLTLTGVQSGQAGAYAVVVRNAQGATMSRVARLRIGPYVQITPGDAQIVSGSAMVLTAIARGFTPTWFQWQREGVDINGATSASYELASAQQFDRGIYSVRVGMSVDTVESSGIELDVHLPPPSGARLTNLSTRALGLTGDKVLIPGFVVAGPGNKQLLLRAVGPSLTKFGLHDVLPDPRLQLKRSNGVGYDDLAANNNWSENANVAAIRARSPLLYAFPLEEGSRDAALLVDLAPGQYSVVADDAGGQIGIAMVELYDADGDTSTSRLVNISTRGFVGTGDNIMIPGFVVSAEGPKTLLIRVIGPTLASFAVPGVLVDPMLSIYRHDSVHQTDELILTNDDWSVGPGAQQTGDVASEVFAFALPNGSKDAAFVVTLNPGIYTVHARGANNTTGVALVEIYAVP